MKPIPAHLTNRLARVVGQHILDYVALRPLLLPVDARTQSSLRGNLPSPTDQFLSDLEAMAMRLPVAGEVPLLLAFIDRLCNHVENDLIAWEELTEIRHLLRGAGSVVATLNCIETTGWHSSLAGAHLVEIPSAQGNWTAEALLGDSRWADGLDAIDRFVADQRPIRAPLHLFASPGYALGAWLGNRVLNLGGGRDVHLYQRMPDGGWPDWGPSAIAPSEGSLLSSSGIEAVAADCRDIALIVEVSRSHDPDQVAAGLSLCGAQSAPKIQLSLPGRFIASPQEAARAAVQVRGTLDALYEIAPKATIHLFFIAPSTLLMLAAQRFHKLNRLVIHERGPGATYRPILVIDKAAASLWPAIS